MENDKAIYYNPSRIHLAGREGTIINENKDGSKLLKFESFGGETVRAYPEDLDGTYKKRCEEKIEEERERIWSSRSIKGKKR